MAQYPPTQKQLDYIARLGYSLTPPRTKTQASILIDSLKAGLDPKECEARLIQFMQGQQLPPLPSVSPFAKRSSGWGCIKGTVGCLALIILAGCGLAAVFSLIGMAK